VWPSDDRRSEGDPVRAAMSMKTRRDRFARMVRRMRTM
jgi:hypothetical protein